MKKVLIFLLMLLLPVGLSAADEVLREIKRRTLNVDESKVAPYTLPDPLVTLDGKKVRNVAMWRERRREILEMFQSEMYGRLPEAPSQILIDTLEHGTTLCGFATRRQFRMWFRADRTGPSITWLVLTPNHVKGPAPAVMMLNYKGNHSVISDPEVVIPELPALKEYQLDKVRGSFTDQNKRSFVPAQQIIARGYAYVTACYKDVSPDPRWNNQESLPYTRIFELWGPRDAGRDDNTTSLMAWAWALMRGLDMLERDPLVDASRVVVCGSSRLGKAALLAGAFDERFKVTVVNQSGGGGITPARRNFGENLYTERHSFSHWFCRAYWKYTGRENEMPFDQNLLAACIAPRALLVEGFNDPWYDTKGEFESLCSASAVWKLHRRKGLPKVAWPESFSTAAIGPCLGYVRRDGKHGLSGLDWKWLLDFADANMR